MLDIRITSDKSEMIEIGRELYKKRRLYTKAQAESIKKTIYHFMPNATDKERDDFFFRSYYDYMVYGFNVDQLFYLHLLDKTHEEKSKYISHASKFLYYSRLNKRKSMHMLEDKFEAYQLLKKYYGREVIRIGDEEDYSTFLDFISKHPIFVVKPIDLSNGLGIRKIDSTIFPDKHSLFLEMLGAGKEFDDAQDYKWSSDYSAAVLEEVIEQDERLNRLNPSSVNGIRVTTIRVGGAVHIYKPWIKVAVGGEFVASATLGGFDACINPETGIVETNGYLEDGSFIEYHPDTNVKIKGFEIPCWDELISIAKEVASSLDDSINYVGWDFVLTPKGWVIMEGNFYGDTMWQMCYDKGMKEDFENLIGWKMEKFWWQYNMSDLEQ
jgi:hypothetical protein